MNSDKIVAHAIIVYEIDFKSMGWKVPEGQTFERRKYAVAQTEDLKNHLVLTRELNKARKNAFTRTPIMTSLKDCTVFQTQE